MGLLTSFSFPAGVGMDYAGNNAPMGWLLCHGQEVSRVTYKKLFDAIGTLYGAGDGVNTFNLPDVRGRVRFAKDNMGGVAANRVTVGGSGLNGQNLAAVGGSESVTLTDAQMPSHRHGIAQDLDRASGGSGGNVTSGNNRMSGFTGSSQAHANIPPAIVFNYIISTGA